MNTKNGLVAGANIKQQHMTQRARYMIVLITIAMLLLYSKLTLEYYYRCMENNDDCCCNCSW